MGLFSRNKIQSLSLASPEKPLEGRSSLENPATPLAGSGLWAFLSGGRRSAAGEVVTETNALENVDVYACVRVLAESVASLPLKLYEVQNNGRQQAFDHPLHDLLAYAPNPEMTAFSFWETTVGCLALTGNAYAQIVRNSTGQVVAFYPLHPLKTEPVRLPTGELAYRTSDGMKEGEHRIVPSKDVLHIPLFCFDGLKGLSPIKMAMQSVGLAQAATKFGARFFGNGSRPGGVMSVKSPSLDENYIHNVRESWEAAQGGENQGKTAFLSGDWNYTAIGLSPEEAQFIKTREYQRTEIGALFRVPPHMIGDINRLSNSNHEQQSLQFVTDTLRPYLCRIEQEVIRKLMPSVGRNSGRYTVEFDVRERLRGDFKTTMEGLALGKQWGYLSTNDIRRELGENPVGPVGDVYLYPINMGNAEALTHPAALAPPQAFSPQAEPKQLPAPDATPSKAERDLLGSLTGTYHRLFKDAVGRLTKREKRDSDVVSGVFQPLLLSIAEESERSAAKQFDFDQDWHGELDKLVREHTKSLEKRAAAWTPEGAEEAAVAELRKAVRAISLTIYREAGVRVALRGTNE